MKQKEIAVIQPPKILSTEQITNSKEMLELSKEVPTLVQRATNFQVTSEKDLETGAEVCSWIRKKLKFVEERRKFFVGPLNDYISGVNNFFKEMWSSHLKEADEIVEGKILRWRQIERERLQEEQKKLTQKALKQAEKKGIPVEEVIVPVVEEQTKSVGAGSFKKYWTFEITDEPKVPREYLTVNEKKIREAVNNGTRQIEGVRIFEEEGFSRR